MRARRFCRSRSLAIATVLRMRVRRCRSRSNEPRPLINRNLFFASALLPLGLIFPVAAHAQLVAAATLETQYRLRGVALSNGQPDLRLALSYDHSSGAYGGVSAIGGETDRNGVQPLGYIGYF